MTCEVSSRVAIDFASLYSAVSYQQSAPFWLTNTSLPNAISWGLKFPTHTVQRNFVSHANHHFINHHSSIFFPFSPFPESQFLLSLPPLITLFPHYPLSRLPATNKIKSIGVNAIKGVIHLTMPNEIKTINTFGDHY